MLATLTLSSQNDRSVQANPASAMQLLPRPRGPTHFKPHARRPAATWRAASLSSHRPDIHERPPPLKLPMPHKFDYPAVLLLDLFSGHLRQDLRPGLVIYIPPGATHSLSWLLVRHCLQCCSMPPLQEKLGASLL